MGNSFCNMKQFKHNASQKKPYVDSERQIETRSSSQQYIIDTQPSTSQCHQNSEDGKLAQRRNIILDQFYKDHSRQKMYESTRQELHNQPQHLREQPRQIRDDSEIIDQSTNWSDKNRLLSVQSAPDNQIDCELESTERELEQSKQQISRLELQKKPQHQRQLQQQDFKMKNVIEKNEQKQDTFNVHNEESQEKLHEFENLPELQLEIQDQQSKPPQKTSSVQEQQDFEVGGMVGGSPMNILTDSFINCKEILENEIITKDRMHYHIENVIETAKRLPLKAQQGSNCDNKFIRRISESELTSQEKFCLSSNQIQEQYREQQPSEEVRSIPIYPPNRRMQNQPEDVIESVKKSQKQGQKRPKKVKNKATYLKPVQQRKIRKHPQKKYQQGLDVGSNFVNKFIRKISEFELTPQQKLCLSQGGNQIQEHYDVIEQPSEEVRSTSDNPPNLHQHLLPPDFELKEVVVQEQQQQHHDMPQELTERSRSNEIEVGIEMEENMHHNTELSIDKSILVMNENLKHADDFDKQYIPEIIRLYEYSSTFRPLIEDFVGTAGSDQHYFIEESLTRTLLELDRIPAENRQQLRLYRRQVIKYIYDLMEMLDNKVQVAQ